MGTSTLQPSQDSSAVRAVFDRYTERYGWNLQGCCLLIADEIKRAIGGEAVAGELTWYGGSCRRTHWWVEKDGKTIDPMGDEFLASEEYPARVEHHRDQAMFERLLPQYEVWRVSPPLPSRIPDDVAEPGVDDLED